MAQTGDLFSSLTCEEPFEIHKFIDHGLFHHDDLMIPDVSDTVSMNFGLTNPILIENTFKWIVQNRLDDSTEMDWLDNSPLPSVFSIQYSLSEETMSYSTMVFSDLMLSSTALLMGHVNENADQDDQYTLSIEESKSLDDFSRIQEIHE